MRDSIKVDPAMDAHQANGLAWAVEQWKQQVQHRPLVNIHRRTLDGVWRQVIKYFDGDPRELVGKAHDVLVDEAREPSHG
jgi:hypothetical protein